MHLDPKILMPGRSGFLLYQSSKGGKSFSDFLGVQFEIEHAISAALVQNSLLNWVSNNKHLVWSRINLFALSARPLC